ncbi:MAG: hypothetical protein EXS14_00320 [Planctomycetes bacterium]|nr:hypothetical protein [Planctomycetota bacterium]
MGSGAALRNWGTVGGSQDVLLLSFAVRMGLGVLVTSTLARVLDADGFGFVAYVGTFLLLAHIALDAGTGVVATREIAAAPQEERHILARLLGFRLLSSLLVALVVFCSAWLEQDASKRMILLCAAMVVPLQALGAFSVPLQVRQRPHGPALVGVCTQGLVLLLLWVTPFGSAWLPCACAAGVLLLREALNALGTLWCTRRACGFFVWPRLDREVWAFIRLAWPQGRFVFLQAAWFHADVFLVRWLCGEEVLATYAAAYRPVVPLLLIPGMLVLPLVPVFAATSVEQARHRVRQLLAVMLGLGSLGAVAACLAPSSLLRLLYPDAIAAEEATIVSLRWLGLAFLLAFASTPLLCALTARRKERLLLRIGAFALLVNVGANLLWTPAGGAVSAAAITAATEACVFVGAAWIWIRHFGSPLGRMSFVALLPAGALAATLAFWQPDGVVLLLLAVAGLVLLLCLPQIHRARRELRALGRG